MRTIARRREVKECMDAIQEVLSALPRTGVVCPIWQSHYNGDLSVFAQVSTAAASSAARAAAARRGKLRRGLGTASRSMNDKNRQGTHAVFGLAFRAGDGCISISHGAQFLVFGIAVTAEIFVN